MLLSEDRMFFTAVTVVFAAVLFSLPVTVDATAYAQNERTVSHPLCEETEDGIVNPEQVAACVREVFGQQERPRYMKAAKAYLRLIEQATTGRHIVRAPAARRALLQLIPILPERLKALTRQHITQDEGVRSNLGKKLVEWWYSQDPLPATKENERLFEHLERVAFAQETYPSSERGAGFDARGEVYVRLGPPGRKTSVSFSGARVIREVIREDRTLMRSDFPENEYWTYPGLSSLANYLFIEGRGGYRLGTTQELAPSTLRRGQRKSESLRVVLEEVYGQLATLNVDFGTWHQELVTTSRASLTNNAANTSELLGILGRQRSEEAKQVQKRLQEVPRQHSNVPANVGGLAIASRAARFLTPDGATRTEVYWSVPLAQLWVERKDGGQVPAYLLAASITQRALRNVQRTARRRRHLITRTSSRSAGAMLAPQTYVTRSTADSFNVRVQWDEYVARRDPKTQRFTQPGFHLRRRVHRYDSLRALRARGGLEMSDLKPLLLNEERLRSNVSELESALPYPFASVSPSTPIGLYFEVYHLGLDKEGATRYTVEYAVVRKEEPQGLAGLFRRAEEQRTTTETTYSSESRMTREYIILDLDEQERQGQVQIVVRVTDEVAGRQAERFLQFGVGSK